MQHEPLAVGEPEAHPPALPAQLVAVEGERNALGLGDLQGLAVGPLAQAGDQRGVVLTLHRRPSGVAAVVDLQERHRVEVDDQLQPGDGVRVRVAAGRGAQPDVTPADAPPGVLLGDEVRAVGPHVDQHERGIGDPPPGQRGQDLGMGTHRSIAVVPLVDGRGGLAARLGVPRGDGVGGEREHGDEGQPLVGAPQHDPGRPGDRVARPVPAHDVLGRLGELDGRDAPLRAPHVAFARQQRLDVPDLVGGERVQRMQVGHGETVTAHPVIPARNPGCRPRRSPPARSCARPPAPPARPPGWTATGSRR